MEQSGVFADAPRLRPDILIRAPNAQPVVIETEYAPASSIEDDAQARLGLVPAASSDPVGQVIAVRIPTSLRQSQAQLPDRIAAADFDYCVISGNPSSLLSSIWPTPRSDPAAQWPWCCQ